MRPAVAETSTPTPPGAVVDLRTYALVPGGRQAFDRIVCEEALPLPSHNPHHVVGYGPSLADSEHYFLARAFASRAEREEQLTAFYGSDEWRQNYEDTVMHLIESYHTVVTRLGPCIAEALEVDAPHAEMAEVAALHRLNDEYMRASVESDTVWYCEHLTDDFVCTLADGRHIDNRSSCCVPQRRPVLQACGTTRPTCAYWATWPSCRGPPTVSATASESRHAIRSCGVFATAAGKRRPYSSPRSQSRPAVRRREPEWNNPTPVL